MLRSNNTNRGLVNIVTSSRWKLIVLTTAAVPFFAVIAWYALSFLPHLMELNLIAREGAKVRESANPAFYRLAIVGESKERIRSYAIREAYWSLVAARGQARTINRQLDEGLWLLMSYVHFSDDEAFALWIECALYGCGHGLMEAAQKHFKKPIGDLTEDELAALVALVKGPGMFAPGTPRGEERKQGILNAYHANS
ncbi:MAG TPA: transglycosylase domain-containing protein [Gallionellaceae bacterium]